MQKFSKVALIAALSLGMAAPVFAQSNPTAGTTNSDATGPNATGSSSTAKGTHVNGMKHKKKKSSSMSSGS